MPAPVRALAVIPAYDEASRIGGVIAGVRAAGVPDILVVDDGSTDATSSEARRAGALVATHAVNLGYGAALQTGYRFALRHGFDAVVQLDADGQHDPAGIPELLSALAEHDVVVGSRFLGGGSYRPPLVRRLGMALFGSIAALLAGRRLTDPTSGYKAISKEVLRFYIHERYPADYPDADVLAMAVRAGFALGEVPARMKAGPPGKSMHGGLLRPLYYVIRMSLALALVPLRSDKR
ncbi:MAG: glycosyltransferase family 2 protein [Myxococcales bacterium]|nr:glycosyltransferase family 2 protein [Myxococcales bacterium]